MFRIAVVDDNLEYAQFVKKKIHEILYREKVVCDVEVFDKPMAFLCEVLEEDAFDVCFLEIEVPSMNGLELGRQLRKFGNRIIERQDKRVVITQKPKASAYKSHEKLLSGDGPIIQYRRIREELKNQ